jgi:glycosyltransferase involved in cell wall biosynthesis
MAATYKRATRIFCVSNSLRRVAEEIGASPERTRTVPNGVDVDMFFAEDRAKARRRLGIPIDARVMITVGGLCRRKGQHRVISAMPDLLARHPNLHYLVVGGDSPEEGGQHSLELLACRLGVSHRVHFLGAVMPEELHWPLSAADIFVLATANEGWANVLLEAMACGLPTVATSVGGNPEVVASKDLGVLVPFDDDEVLVSAIANALSHDWDREAIVEYAYRNQWDSRVDILVKAFQEIFATGKSVPAHSAI